VEPELELFCSSKWELFFKKTKKGEYSVTIFSFFGIFAKFRK
jgi:hypothetical protein